jgi:hypothetical protein
MSNLAASIIRNTTMLIVGVLVTAGLRLGVEVDSTAAALIVGQLVTGVYYIARPFPRGESQPTVRVASRTRETTDLPIERQLIMAPKAPDDTTTTPTADTVDSSAG